MGLDPNTVGTGYAFLDGLKGVVIGPTINEFAAAIAGGTVGVMGTLITLEIRRQRRNERKQCPYCIGTGKLPCGHCYTLGYVPCADSVTAQRVCEACGGTGYVECNHVSFFTSFSSTLLLCIEKWLLSGILTQCVNVGKSIYPYNFNSLRSVTEMGV